MVNNKKSNDNFRHIIQVLWTLVTNAYIIGFIRGKIYQGKIKNVCVPGLNCYSCPGAVASCPIGALQAVIGSYEYKFSFYIAGFFIIIGTFMGRFVCGYLCPFGLFQDLLNKIPLRFKVSTFKFDKILRYFKYLVLIVFVVLMPIFITDIIGQGFPWFCKLICPAGTLEGGVPLVLLNDAMRSTVGLLFGWKFFILIAVIILSVIIYRPFCKYVCPLGAIYSLFNPISAFKYSINTDKCINCKMCAQICKMGCNPVENPNSMECIRCGKCRSICSEKAIEYTFFNARKKI